MTNWLSKVTDKYGQVVTDVLTRLNTYSSTIEPPKQTYPITTVDTMRRPSESNNYLTLDKFDQVEYDSSHLWFCTLDGAPAPFDKWFPAQSLDEPSKGVQTSTISYGLEEVVVLNNYNAVNLRVEVIDDDNATLEQWLKAWQKDCSATESGMPYSGFRYLDEIVHKLTMTKYNYQKQKVYTRQFLVLPVGDINLSKTNDPTLKVLNINFATFGQKEI